MSHLPGPRRVVDYLTVVPGRESPLAHKQRILGMATTAATAASLCLPYTVEVVKKFFDVDKAWVGGAFFLGLLIGALIAVLVARLCIKDVAKYKVGPAPASLQTGFTRHCS